MVSRVPVCIWYSDCLPADINAHGPLSVTNVHSTIRPTKDIPNNATTRSRRYLPQSASTGSRLQSDGGRYRANIRGGRRAVVLDRQWAVSCQNLTGVCYQVPHVRVFCQWSPFLVRGYSLSALIRRNVCSQSMWTAWKISAILVVSAGFSRVVWEASAASSVRRLPLRRV